MGTYLESLNRSLMDLVAEDPRVYILGEDILDPYGGAFKVTRGLSSRFPDRVLTTPISEAALAGLAGGMALRGLRPILEIMFGDFATLCTDQVVNHLSKYREMYARQVDVPVVIRTPMGGGRGYGPTHSQSLEKLFLGIPGLKVVAASRLHDPGALLRQAVADSGPVLFIENKLLYPTTCLTPDAVTAPLHLSWKGNPAFPTAVLENFAAGQPDVLLLTYGGGSRQLDQLLLNLADEEVQVTAALPSLVSQPDFDLLAELAETARAGVVVWEEGTQGFDWGAELIAGLHAKLGTKLGTVRRLAALPTVIPAARHLEHSVLPGTEDVQTVVFGLLEEALMGGKEA